MLYMTNERYESARKIYQSIGVDTEAALDRLKNVPVSMRLSENVKTATSVFILQTLRVLV